MPFVFITGHDRSVLPAGHRARLLISKPYDERELRETLAACMAGEIGGAEVPVAEPAAP